jgi:hypothetical protein
LNLKRERGEKGLRKWEDSQPLLKDELRRVDFLFPTVKLSQNEWRFK